MDTIIINGTRRPLGEATTLDQLFATLGVTVRKMAVEKNGEIIPRSALATTAVQPGDQIELIQFVGGG